MTQLFIYTILDVVLKLLATAAACLLTVIGYRLLLHPLSSVPGPRLAAVSNIWHALHARNGSMLELAKTIHHRYGPVVRVGPNEVWLDSKEAYLKVYSATSGFEKSSFYVALALNRPRLSFSPFKLRFPDTLDLLGEFDLDRYKLQRRFIGPLYQTRSLLKHETAIDNVLLKALAQLQSIQGQEVDLKEWMHIIVVECLSAVVLSWSPGFLRDKSDHGSGAHAYLGWRRKSVFGLFPVAELLDAYCRPLGRLFARIWRLTFRPPKHFKALFPLLGQKISRRINAASRPCPPKDDRQDLAAELIELHKSKPEFTKEYLRRMTMTNFGAGHETTTSALASAISMIAAHSVAKSRVNSDVVTALPKSGSRPITVSYETASSDELKYTRAAIKEAQRLYPVIGMSLSRTVPDSGLHVDGHFIPPGISVGCNPLALHRNRGIFGPDADTYRPDRWLPDPELDPDQEQSRLRDMERCNLIYGGGARLCPGRYLADILVLKIVMTLFRNFEIQVTEFPDDGETCFYFMAMLTGVKVRFCLRTLD